MVKQVLSFFCLLVFGASLVWSEGLLSQEFTKAEILASKKTIVLENMRLNADDEKKFLKFYDEYQIDMNKLNEERTNIVAKFAINYQTVDDGLAEELLSRVLALDKKKASIKKEWMEKMKNSIRPSAVARFYQIENKLEAIVMMDAALQIPLIKKPKGE